MSVYGLLAGIFAVIMLVVAMPTTILVHTRPKIRIFQVVNVVSLIAAVIDMFVLFIAAYIDDMLPLWGCLFLCVTSLVFVWFMYWILQRRSKERIRFFNDAFVQTDQHPEMDNYGFSKDNPIWTGTAQKYLDRLFTDKGEKVSWKYDGDIRLYTKNEDENFEYKGFTDCYMSKYKLTVDGKEFDTVYICRKAGFDQLPYFFAPKGFVLK